MNPEATWPLKGTWYNELGSVMVIHPLNSATQTVTGTYTSAVSSSGCAKGDYALVGRGDVQNGGQTFGWTVCWRNDVAPPCNSTTSWSGKYLVVNGDQTISALWLVMMDTKDPADWASTYIGHDIFTRKPPSEEEVARALQLKRPANP